MSVCIKNDMALWTLSVAIPAVLHVTLVKKNGFTLMYIAAAGKWAITYQLLKDFNGLWSVCVTWSYS